jgi:aspartate racemase
MPSRVRAALYGENRQQLTREMSDSVRNLEKSGCNRILLACNTAHLFLPDIMKQVPEAEGKIVNIIEVCADGLIENDEKEVFLLASEGTIDSGIYQKVCSARGIRCEAPCKEEYSYLRECIEAVKRDQYSDAVRAAFAELIHRGSVCVLGCTELPILYERYWELCSDVRVYDPMYMALSRIRKEFTAG